MGGICLHKKEGITLYPEVCIHNLQYDWRPDGHFLVLVGMWNLGSMSENGGKFVKN